MFYYYTFFHDLEQTNVVPHFNPIASFIVRRISFQCFFLFPSRKISCLHFNNAKRRVLVSKKCFIFAHFFHVVEQTNVGEL